MTLWRECEGDGYNPLMDATSNGHEEVVRLLVERGEGWGWGEGGGVWGVGGGHMITFIMVRLGDTPF